MLAGLQAVIQVLGAAPVSAMTVDTDPPFEFTVHGDELAEVNGQTGSA